MADIDAEILRLFRALDTAQKQEFICLALSLLKAEPEETASDQGSVTS